jgi:hypothetical protein
MGMHESRGNLHKNMRDLLVKWAETKLHWSDEVADRFEADVLEVLERDLRTAMSAMDQAGILLSQVRHECSEQV